MEPRVVCLHWLRAVRQGKTELKKLKVNFTNLISPNVLKSNTSTQP